MRFEFSYEVLSFLIVSLLLIYSLLQWKNKNNTTNEKQPPLPSFLWPIIGHLHHLGSLPHKTFDKLADKYGPIFTYKIGVHKILVISSTEMAKECFTGINDKVFLHRPQFILGEHMFYNSAMFAFSPYGIYWREMRKIVTVELLSIHRLEMSKDLCISEVRTAIQRIKLVGSDTTLVDMKEWFGDISMNTIVRLVSGKSFKEFCQSEENYKRGLRVFGDFFELAGSLIPGDALPFLRWLDIGGHERKMQKTAKKIDDIAQKWLEEHKYKRKSNDEVKEDKDLIDLLLDVFEKGNEKTSKYEVDTIIKATSILMIFGGTETVTATLIWALSLLLNNKDVLKKTQAELDTIVGKERKVEEYDLKNLVYLQAVIKETMRLYPPAPLSVPREAITDCTVGGYHIPARTILFVSLHKIQRDPKVWERPLQFDPERFLTTRKDCDFKGQNLELMPFGGGRRICPGISFALRSLQFTLANLLHGFQVCLPSDDQTVDMTDGFGIANLKATPLEVMLTPRLPHSLYN